MALNSLFCADVPLSNYTLTHALSYVCVTGQHLSEYNVLHALSFRFTFEYLGWLLLVAFCDNYYMRPLVLGTFCFLGEAENFGCKRCTVQVCVSYCALLINLL